MPKSDRAFRALSRAQPDVIASMLRVLTPRLMPPNVQLVPDDVAPTHLDGLPPELDADWAVRVAEDDFVHLECQGYNDASFSERVLWYHLGFALRNRGKRRVRTVALWLKPLPAGQPRNLVAVSDISVRVKTIVLPDVLAVRLLVDPSTACFAAGANAGPWSEDELCRRVVTALAERKASWAERHMATVAALTRSEYRYEMMLTAMEQANLEPVIIEDLVKYGEHRARRDIYAQQFAQRLERALTEREKATLLQRIETLGVNRINEMVWNSNPDALVAWLANPKAR